MYFTDELRGVRQHTKHMYYVDDLQIYVHSSLDELDENLALINKDVIAVYNWADSNKLKINLNKTYSMIIKFIMKHNLKKG